ncbi:hypothetical protein IB234_11745 [Pseudomonas sp. PDM16]|uniref:hypothetical protein n=1 Tax=Pseudomonas sp. PDM16 TaxID=2769292 RepID=UPI00177F0F8B|nr:hypothetical protein [Pseudomonas sp. PDM16]MBD9415227.1 hypothetical protein [Pseudomonas sp. PDM16]
MSPIEFYLPGTYENPLTPSGRGRTIAAFYLAQGDADTLSKGEMRRDILNKLMSPSAVSYWLNSQGWLEKTRKVGKVQLVRLTSKGIVTCKNSVNGGADVSTTEELVTQWRSKLKNGSPSFSKMSFDPLPTTTSEA